VPASLSTVGVGEPDRGDWSSGDVVEPESDDGAVGVEAEPVQPVATNAATTRLTSDRELFKLWVPHADSSAASTA